MRRSRIAQAVAATAAIGVLGVTGLLTSRVEVGAIAGPTNLAAGLLGSNESPPGDPDGTGSAKVTVNTNTNMLFWEVFVSGIDSITMAHIHHGVAGANGPIVFDFGGALSGSGSLAAPLAADIAANPQDYYVNIHTTLFPGGAIRGQLADPGIGNLVLTRLPTPLRVYDSRANGGMLASNETRNIVLISGKNDAGVLLPAVPIGAYAAQVVITVTQTSAGGYLAAHAAGSPVPATSSINWSAVNTNIATGTVVPVDATGRMAISAGPNSTTHVIIDVIGYFSLIATV